TLLATAAATGEQPTEGTPDEAAAGPAPGADRAVLQTSLAAAGAVPATVTPGAEPAPDAPSAEGRSADLAAAVDGLRKQLDATLDAIVARSAGAATKAFTGLLSFAPHVVKQVIDDLGKRVKLGAVTSRLFRAALWSLDQALGALQRLIPSRLLAGVRAQIQSVCDRLREEPATDVAIGAALGVGAVTEYAVVALNRTDLAVERLVDGTNEL